ncbi:MAG: hypothetical protein H8E98_05230 [Bacteroidetes bacterium]|nr:hypothetical protein [Bacteroidota bacterium]
MTREELSKTLEITVKKLHAINLLSQRKKISSEITLKLVRLYCQTKWEEKHASKRL